MRSFADFLCTSYRYSGTKSWRRLSSFGRSILRLKLICKYNVQSHIKPTISHRDYQQRYAW